MAIWHLFLRRKSSDRRIADLFHSAVGIFGQSHVEIYGLSVLIPFDRSTDRSSDSLVSGERNSFITVLPVDFQVTDWVEFCVVAHHHISGLPGHVNAGFPQVFVDRG